MNFLQMVDDVVGEESGLVLEWEVDDGDHRDNNLIDVGDVLQCNAVDDFDLIVFVAFAIFGLPCASYLRFLTMVLGLWQQLERQFPWQLNRLVHHEVLNWTKPLTIPSFRSFGLDFSVDWILY